LIKIKASEFDKVDQMKLNVELDAKNRHLTQENQKLSEQKNSEEARAGKSEKSAEEL